ncbi:uncharacterized protein LOC132922674 isoform X7 [Rhopalosiphum padi]|uniref:uncharacterized protein LOC132922674 isoform X7 n=1 Tax=Rhopalosiphum padi TaxID=40932 RepID=UPI00298DB982|nr:uncharacterized protein LOC132922674 isoform X7 [Rhopalosiphum padi]
MAQLINLKLSRNDQSSPWGFRLQGGKDFGTPLLIQKVNFGSLAEKAGLQVGDALVRVNNQDVYDVKHKDAQDVILGAGNAFEVTIQRGGTSTWKPSVTPVGPSPVPSRLSQSPQILTKTSLAKVGPQSPAFGSSHNSVSRPYSGTSSPKVNSSGYNNDSGTVKAIVNKQYNTPVGIYSEENIAETLTAQAEVLAGGVLGVNFKKNEKNYEANKSEVFKMVQEADKEPRDLETDLQSKFAYFSASSHAIGGRATSPRPITPIAANMHMPEQRDPYLGSPLKEVDKFEDNAKRIECSDCRNDIIGVFVRIKDKSLHVECFKCATCGSSLKNVGYFNINNKLYCDIHAKMVARQNPPTPNLEPVTVAPGSNPPLGSFNIIPNKSKDVQSVQSPQPSTLSPIPFHAPKAPSHVNAPKQQTPSKVFSNAKPYEAPKQTPTAPIFTSGYNQVQTDEPKYKANSLPRLPFLKPKLLIGSAFCPVVSKTVLYDSGKRASICSQEVCRTMTELKHSLNDSIADQLLIESTKKGRPHSPIPDDKGQDFTSAEAPHDVRSLLPENNNMRAISPNQLITFPPEIPSEYRTYSKPHTPEPKNKTFVMDDPVMTNAFKTKSQLENVISRYPDDYSEHIELNCLPRFHGSKGPISMAMEIAPDRPFTPIALTEPIIKPALWVSLPVENENRPESPLVAALKTAPERSYSPLPTFIYASELLPTPMVDPTNETNKTMSNFQTQNINFESTDIKNSTRPIGNNPVRYMHGYNNKTSEILLQKNKELPQQIQSVHFKKEPITGLKSSEMSFDKLSISGPYEPIKSKSNYNETFITQVPNFEEHKKNLPECKFTTSNQNMLLNQSQFQKNITKPPQISVADNLSTANRSMGPGIKNKVSTFTPNTLISDTSFLNKSSNNYNKVVSNINKSISTTDNSFKYKSNHPSTVKLSKAIPFFSNTTSSPSSPEFTKTL